MRFGYTLMTEQSGPRALVRHAAAAEYAGFDFEVMSDHYSPWLDSQNHAPYAWSVLGAVAQATERTELMTYVTAPIMRYHPAVVAQKAATVSVLSGERFILGLGAGENLNEHVIGAGWPSVTVRHEMLGEAVEIIRELLRGGPVDYVGEHYRVDAAKLWDLPESHLPLAVAVSGPRSVHKFAQQVDHLIAVEPRSELCQLWEGASGAGSRKIGQLPICWDTDRAAARRRAREQFRWFAGGWKVNAELPDTQNFAAATDFVTEDDVAANIPCGPEVGPILDSASAFAEAGFTDLALVQIGHDEHQQGFFDFAENELLPALRNMGAAA